MWFKKIKEILQENSALLENKEQIQRHNMKIIDFGMISLFTVLAILYSINFINETITAASSSYLIVCIVLAVFYFITKKNKNLKSHLFVAYSVILIFYAFLIYLSVVVSPNERAAALVGGICMLPLLIIDKLWRIILVTLSVVLISGILALYFKPYEHASVDIINSAAFAIGGIIFGWSMNKTRLKSFSLEKALMLQRNIDHLTNLRNRRKLYELLEKIKNNEIVHPSCVIMMDIDHFKKYNDKYGHTVGDEFLRRFGEELLLLEKLYSVKFYRYGGEEVAAFLWGYQEPQQIEITEKIRLNVENMEIEHGSTVSIGYLNCLEFDKIDCEEAIALADTALYQAKNTGRNKVVAYNENQKI